MREEEESADDYIDENIIPIVLALLAGAAVPATIMAVWAANDFGAAITLWVISFLIALAHAFGLGLPGFILLQRLGYTKWWVSLIGGFVVGAIPAAIYTWYSEKSLTGSFLGLLGMPGGFVAWLVWYLGTRAKKHSP